MAEEAPAGAIALEVQAPVPEAVDADRDFSLTLRAACSYGCELSGAPFIVRESGDVLVAGRLPCLTGDRHDTAAITLRAPQGIGEFEWTVVVPSHTVDGVVHDEGSVTLSFRTRPHATSLAVWDHPSAVVVGQTFHVNVGVKCSAGCLLGGHEIEIQDETGARAAIGTLGDTPWSGTTGLFWTSMEMTAPAAEGRFSWSIAFLPAESRVPHDCAASTLALTTVPSPEHRVSIQVVEKGTDTPLREAHVRLGMYRESTDDAGVATFEVPGGEHRLFIWKAGYDAPERTIDVAKSENLRIEAKVLPEDNPDAYWQG